MVYDFHLEAGKIIPGCSVITGINLHPVYEDEPRVGQ